MLHKAKDYNYLSVSSLYHSCPSPPGSAPPGVPKNVNTVPAPSKAVIIFTVPNVTYTPETYFVVYGLTSNTLNQTSNMIGTRRVNSIHSFITVQNEVYNITIVGLMVNRMYFYRVVASNGYGYVTTDVFNFTTGEAGEPCILLLVCYLQCCIYFATFSSTSFRFLFPLHI